MYLGTTEMAMPEMWHAAIPFSCVGQAEILAATLFQVSGSTAALPSGYVFWA